MAQPELNPKTLVWYPLFSFVFCLILYIMFEAPIWIFFIWVFFTVLYFVVFIISELFRK